jgi:hypothetical protein
MNKSYSKIRHIQEANKNLEKRFLNEINPPIGMMPVQGSPQSMYREPNTDREMTPAEIEKANSFENLQTFDPQNIGYIVAKYLNVNPESMSSKLTYQKINDFVNSPGHEIFKEFTPKYIKDTRSGGDGNNVAIKYGKLLKGKYLQQLKDFHKFLRDNNINIY